MKHVIHWGEPDGPVHVLKQGQVPREFPDGKSATKEARRLNAVAIAKEVPWRYWAALPAPNGSTDTKNGE